MLLLKVTRYLGYSSLTDFFPTMDIKPNPSCDNALCRNLQKGYQDRFNLPEAVAARAEAQRKAAEEAQVDIAHEENEWQIEVVPEVDAHAMTEQHLGLNQLAPGLHYELPVNSLSSSWSPISFSTTFTNTPTTVNRVSEGQEPGWVMPALG